MNENNEAFLTPGIVGLGKGLPDKVITNLELEKMVETSDEWITSRTGIKERRVLEKDEPPSSLAVSASREALDNAPIDNDDVDLLVVATNVSDMPIPGSSPFVADKLDLRPEIPFFDLKAGCSGFLYSLDVAYNFVLSGNYHNVLVVGLEALSRVVNWDDRSTCVLFGDAAGAGVVSRSGSTGRILASSTFGDPSKLRLIRLEGGGTRFPPADGNKDGRNYYVEMEGKGVFKSAVNMMKSSSLQVLTEAGYSLDEVDWIVPHQANIRIIKQLAKSMGITMDRVIVNLDRYANTSTATIPVALEEAVSGGSIQSGDLVLLTAFGAGAAYGATLIEW
ncbi:MAG: 3-oxoacyl-ACP synthase III family protein [Candidatus Acetothermia bacterium]